MDYGSDDEQSWVPFLDEESPLPGQVSPYATATYEMIQVMFNTLLQQQSSSSSNNNSDAKTNANANAQGQEHFLVDLGCGDGRIVVFAAERYGIRGIGVEINPKLIEKAQRLAEERGVSHLVDFRLQSFLDDSFTFRFNDFKDHQGELCTTLITAYLVPKALQLVDPKLRQYMRESREQRGVEVQLATGVFSMDASAWRPKCQKNNLYFYDASSFQQQQQQQQQAEEEEEEEQKQ